MIAVFKQKSPGNIVLLLLFGLLIKLPLFLYPRQIVSGRYDGQLYRWLIGSLPQGNALPASLIAFALLYIQAMMLNYLVNEYRMITRQTYLPAMSYLLVTTLLPQWNYLSSPLVANTFIIWMFITLFRLYNQQGAKARVYNTGVLAGLASFIYFPSAAFVICMILGLMILKPFRLNEIVLFLLGCTTLYYFYGVYLFLADGWDLGKLVPQVTVRVPIIRSSIMVAGAVLLLTIPFLVGGYYVQVHLRKMLIQVRKNWTIMLLYLLLSFFVPFINSEQNFFTWILITAPFAAFHACAYNYTPRAWLALLLFFATVGFILYMQYGTPAWR